MTKRITFTVALALILMGSVALSSYAEKETKDTPRHGKKSGYKEMARMHKSPFSVETLKAGLDLNDKQVVSMRALSLDYKKGTIMKEAEIKIAELELMELFNQKTLDLPAMQTQLQKLGFLRTGLSFFRIEMLQQAQSFLNNKQFAKFKDYSMKRAKSYMGMSMGSQMMNRHPMGMKGRHPEYK